MVVEGENIMTPERARELLDHKTELFKGFKAPTITVGDIEKHMTKQEIIGVKKVWENLGGNYSFYSTLLHISREVE